MTALLAASMTLPPGVSFTDLVVELTVRVGATDGSKRGAACRSRASERCVHMTGLVATCGRSPRATTLSIVDRRLSDAARCARASRS